MPSTTRDDLDEVPGGPGDADEMKIKDAFRIGAPKRFERLKKLGAGAFGTMRTGARCFLGAGFAGGWSKVKT